MYSVQRFDVVRCIYLHIHHINCQTYNWLCSEVYADIPLDRIDQPHGPQVIST